MYSLFSFQNSVSKDILVIKHTLRDPLVLSSQIYLLSPTGHSLFSFFLFFSSPLFFLFVSLLSLFVSSVRSFFSFLFFLPFCLSHLRPIKKNQRLGQRIGCCGFVNFLGASRMLMNFLGLCFKLRTEMVVVGIRG